LAAAVAAGIGASASAATTQTFTTDQSPFPPDPVWGVGPNQGTYDWDYFSGVRGSRGPYYVWGVDRRGANSYFTFDLRSSCHASSVTLRLVRGSELGPGQDGGADFAIHEVTTPAEVVNGPYTQEPIPNTFEILRDLEDGPQYWGGPYPLEGSPSDLLSFPLNAAGVAAFNAARGEFFTLGGSGGGRSYRDSNLFLHRNLIFAGVSDLAKLVVTCALPTTKEDCKNGGWRNFPGFRNQGDCVSFVARHGKNPPAR
jgi:hypothetical protein